MSNDLKTPEGRTARCNSDMVQLQLEVGISLTEPERKVYALAWRDGCMAALEHARNELVLCLPTAKPTKEQPLPDIIP